MRNNIIKCILLPFAGGSRYSYNPLVKKLPPSIKPVYIELPGRGSRINENLLYDLSEMAEDIFAQIECEIDEKYVLFGHSMGAILGYLLIKLLHEKNHPLPFKFIVSGRTGLFSNKKEIYHSLPSVEFRNKLRELGGCPDDVLENEQLMFFFEPIIKADFKAVEDFNAKIFIIDVPVTVLHGSYDTAAENQVPLWSDISQQEVTIYNFPGKHFFIFSHSSEVIATVIRDLDSSI